jgi:nucleotide-binding universal stress UspA family protein
MAVDTVLVAVGQSDGERVDSIASAVRDVAGPAGARVVVVHVFSEEGFSEFTEHREFERAKDPDAVAQRHQTVMELQEQLDSSGLDVQVRGGVGDKGQIIIDTAEEVGADMVFVGGRRRSPTGKAVFGSTAQEVMLNAPCPVTLVRGD